MNHEVTRILIVDGKLICGGVEAFLMNIYRHIDRTKVQFDFLVHYRERFFYDDEVERLGGKIYRLSFRNDHRLHKYKRDLRHFFKAHPEYKVVWGHMDGLASIYLKEAKKAGVPLTIAHSHITSAEHSLKGLVKRFLRRGITRWADECFACSTEAGRYLFGNHPFTLIPNAIDVERFRYSADTRDRIREERHWQNAYVIGHIGRFNAQKNHRYLVDIFKAYAAVAPDAVLCLCGDGENRPAIEKYVQDCGLSDRVFLTGNIPNANDYYQAFDLFLLPSLYEGLPVSGIEAQTSGLQCLFADTITRETALVPGACDFRPIDRPAEEWAADITACRQCPPAERAAAYEAVRDTRFNIARLAKEFETRFTEKNDEEKNTDA